MKKKNILIIALFLSFVASASSAQYDFTRSTILDSAPDSEITFRSLQPDTQYTFVRGDGRQIRTFTSSATGTASVTFDFSPIKDGYGNLTSKGFFYELQSTGASDENVFIYPGYFIRGFDHNDDNTVNSALYSSSVGNQACSNTLQESGSSVSISCSEFETEDVFVSSTLDYDVSIHHTQELKTSFTVSTSDSDSRHRLQVNGYGTITLHSSDEPHTETYDLRAYYNNSANAIQAYWNGKSGSIPVSGTPETFNVSIYSSGSGFDETASASVSADRFAIIPKDASERWNTTGSFGFKPEEGLLKYSLQPDLVKLEGSPAIAWAGYTPSAGDSGFTFNLEEVGAWNALAMSNTQNGTAEYLSISITEAQGFQDLRPEDDIVLTNETSEFSFKYNLDVNGFLRFFYSTDGGETFEFREAKYSATGDCGAGSDDEVVRTTVQKDLCAGERITAEVDTSSLVNRTYWGFQVEGYFNQRLFNSETRSFRRLLGDSNVAGVLPLEGTTLTTLKPRFIGQYNTFQSGTARLELDGNTINSWILQDAFNGRLSYRPSVGLTEGDHDYQFIFDGVAGQTTKSDLVNFSVNTSLADDLNVSLISPKDDDTLTTGNVPLRYNVETSASAESTVYLDGTPVANQGINTGNNNYTLEIRDMDAGEHRWFVTVNESNIIYQSDLSDFTVRNNVTIKRDVPRQGETVQSPPVIFNGTLNTTGEGTLSLLIDGSVRDSQQFKAREGLTYEYVVDSNLESGKHTYKLRYVTDQGESFETNTRTFNLQLGTQEVGRVEGAGGALGKFLYDLAGPELGLSQGQIMIILSFLLSIVGAVLGHTFAGENAGIGGFVFGVLVFSAIGWMPWYIGGVVLVVAALVTTGAVQSIFSS